jgi:hypothetical protein
MRPMSERASGRFGTGLCYPFLIAQDARVRGDSHDDVPMEPTMYGRLAYAMSKDGNDGDNEPMWS